jgi:hypothetical protein
MSMRDPGTLRRHAAQARTHVSDTFAAMLNDPKVVVPEATDGGGATSGASAGGL